MLSGALCHRLFLARSFSRPPVIYVVDGFGLHFDVGLLSSGIEPVFDFLTFEYEFLAFFVVGDKSASYPAVDGRSSGMLGMELLEFFQRHPRVGAVGLCVLLTGFDNGLEASDFIYQRRYDCRQFFKCVC